MNRDSVLLAQLLATDDNFALEFSNREGIDEKFELVQTKINNYEKKDFISFMNDLQSLERENQKLSLEELEHVSGGMGKNSLKLAAITFLGLTLAPLASSGTTSAVVPPLYIKFASHSPDESTFDKKSLSKVQKLKRSISSGASVTNILYQYRDLNDVKEDNFTDFLGTFDRKGKITDLESLQAIQRMFEETELGKKNQRT